MTENNEQILLTRADKLESIANEIENFYNQYGFTCGEIEASGKEKELESLKMDGTLIYKAIIPVAHEVYFNWPKAKQIRGSRQLRLAMAEAGAWSHNQGGVVDTVEEIEKGEYGGFTLENCGSLKTLAYGLRELVRENKNSDETDPYWERIKDAFLIRPNPGLAVRCLITKENGRGNFDRFYSGPSLSIYDSRITFWNGKRKLKKTLKGLVGNKVIFFPIKTTEDSTAYDTAQFKQPEMPFEFEVEDNEVIKTIKAEEHNLFKESDAKYVNKFFKKHIFKN